MKPDKTIAISDGTRTTMRILLIVGACLVMLIPLGIAGGAGVFAAVENHGTVKKALPADMTTLAVDAKNCNVDVVAQDADDAADGEAVEPSVEITYLGLGKAQPTVDVKETSGSGDQKGAQVTLDCRHLTQWFGTSASSATVKVPQGLAAGLGLKVSTDAGSTVVTGYTADGGWTDRHDGAGWASNDDAGDSVVNPETFSTARFKSLDVSTGSGNIRLDALSAESAKATAKSGSVSVAGAFTDLTLQTTSGTARFNAAVSGTVKASAAQGNVLGDLGTWRPYAQPANGVDLRTKTGNIDLSVPRAETTDQSGKAFRGYKLNVPGSPSDRRVRIAQDSSADAIPLRAQSDIGNVKVGYSKVLKSDSSGSSGDSPSDSADE